MKLLIFLGIPFLVKIILPEWIVVGVCLMIVLVINVFETIWTRFSLFGFESWWVYFEVCFITPHKMIMMFNFVRIVIFDTFDSISVV